MNDRLKFRYVYEDKVYDVVAIEFDREVVYLKNGYLEIIRYDNLLQCTGLKDKNGTLIYEGDIVKVIPEEDNAVIEWHNNTARYITRLIEQKAYLGFDGYDDYEDVCGTEFEVIGNIYENPELLKGELA